MNKTTMSLVRAALFAALYAVITMAFAPISFGMDIQFRLSETLTILPLFYGEAVIGLWIGCMLGNIAGGNVIDIFFGAFATLLAAFATYVVKKTVKPFALKVLLGSLPPIIINAFLVPLTFSVFIGDPSIYWIGALSVLIGQSAVLAVLGVPFAIALEHLLIKRRIMDNGMKNSGGKTLTEFLSEYDPTRWKKPAVTADCIIFAGSKVLLVKRGNHPCIGQLAFPGGFCESGEPTEVTAARELKEETGADCPNIRQFYTASTPCRDPRDWIMTVCYIAELDAPLKVSGGDDAADAAWYDLCVEYPAVAADKEIVTLTLKRGVEIVSDTLDVVRDGHGKVDINATKLLSSSLAFDHAKILLRASEDRR